MLLRSGKIKEPVARCYGCNKYYGNKRYKYKCSGCYKGMPIGYLWEDKKFRISVNEWARKKTQIIKNSGGFNSLKKMIRCAYNGSYNKNTRVSACKDFIYGLKEEYSEIYISAKDGEELLRRTGIEADDKSHIICPLILDWWNMKKYNFNSTEMCYYGRFGDEMTFCETIKTIPPPPPNGSLNY